VGQRPGLQRVVGAVGDEPGHHRGDAKRGVPLGGIR
jgi:hypothetical protein